MKIALIGFGVVGQGLVEILQNKQDMLRKQYNFQPEIVAVATRSRGTLYHPDGLDLDDLLATGNGELNTYPDSPSLVRSWSVLEIIKQSNADVIIEVAHSNLDTGLPAIDHVKTAFENKKHVVLANKGPVALAFNELNTLAKAHDVQFRYEATVMAGTPSLMLAQEALRGTTITEARGILNGTTNYILTRMEAGLDYATALEEAQAKGYAEADPTADVDGWDAAGKVLILASVLFGKSLTFDEINVKGISHLTAADIEAAKAAGERWKLIARVTPDGGHVSPMRLAITDPLAGVSGATNAITFATDLLGDVTLIGAGAGRTETGFGILADLIALNNRLKKFR